MFALTIIDSDAFLEMPASTQVLYFHLSMRADDDGFVNNPKRIMRMIGAAEDDLKLLFAKRFLIGFETGVVVIKHWKIHNYIQADRYKKTYYQDEFARLETKPNKAYTEKRKSIEIPTVSTECIQNVSKMDTQVRLGKDRLGKDSKDKGKEKDKDIFADFVAGYHLLCPSLPKVIKISDARKRVIKARIKEFGLEDIKTVFEKTESSDFLTGKTSDFKASFDWILKPANLVKILEGNYDNRKPKNKEPLGGRVNVSAIEEYERLKNEGQL